MHVEIEMVNNSESAGVKSDAPSLSQAFSARGKYATFLNFMVRSYPKIE